MHDVRLDCRHQDASGERTRLAIGVQEALCASADRDRARDPARSRMAEPCHRYEAAQRRLHHTNPRRRAPDHLRNGDGGHRQDGRHATGRCCRSEGDYLFRGRLDNCPRRRADRRHLWQPGAGLHIAPASLDEKAVAGYISSAKSLTIVDFLVKMIPSNLVGAIAQGDLLPVLVIAILFGFALCQMGERGQRLVSLIDDAMHALFGIVRIIMYVAPLAAFGAIAFTIGKFGFGILASLGQLVVSIYLTSILFVLISFGAIAWLFGLPLLKIIRYFKDELLIAFTATSGEAMIPRSIEKLQRMGCSEETVGLVLPTGFSFNTVLMAQRST